MDCARIPRIAFVTVLCLLTVSSAGIVAAQSAVQASDDFEDGDASGWDGEFEISDQSINGDYSIYQNNSMVTDPTFDSATWSDGPELQLSEQFNVSGTSRVRNSDAIPAGTRLGMVNRDTGETLAIQFGHDAAAETAIRYSNDTGIEHSDTTINRNFNNNWVNFELFSSGDGVIYAKVWEVGTSEPSSLQLSLEQEGFNGEFALQTGSADEGRELWVDDVELAGERAETDENININTRLYLEHGQSAPYEVIYETGNESNGTLERTDVTDSATVSSGDVSVVTVDQEENEIIATDDNTINNRTFVEATYSTGGETYTDRQNVTVANATVDNLDILPTWTRVSASLDDETLQLIIVSTMIGAAAAILASSFAGLTAATGITVLGWFAGMASDGILIVAFLMAIFIGLNLAGNINMQVRQ